MAYGGTTMANTLKVVGVDLASAGNIDADNVLESRVVSDDSVYKKVVLEKDRIVGCIMLGSTKGFSRVTKAMEEKLDVSGVKDQILSDNFEFKG
jgi:nitrite reductase (NADH) large subunit